MYCWNKTFRACENLQKLKQDFMNKVTLKSRLEPDFISNFWKKNVDTYHFY